MTITVLCPGCESKLTAPAVAAGKKVKCPKCQAMMLVPADEPANDFEVVDDDFEVVDDAPAKPKKPPASDDFEVIDDAPAKSSLAATRSPRSGARDDEPPRKLAKRYVPSADDDRPRRKREEDDDDDFDDRPRKKKGKKAASPLMLPLLIGGGVLAALAVIVVVYVFAFMGEAKSGTVSGPFTDTKRTDMQGTNNSGDPGWTRFDAPDHSFAVYFPEGSPENANLMDILTCDAFHHTPAELALARQQMEPAIAMGITLDGWSRKVGSRRYSVGTMKYLPEQAKNINGPQVIQMMSAGMKDGAIKSGGKEKFIFEKNVTVAGQSGKQVGIGSANSKKAVQIVTILYVNGKVIFLVVDGEEIADSDEMLSAFIGKVTAVPGSTPAASPQRPMPRTRGGVKPPPP